MKNTRAIIHMVILALVLTLQGCAYTKLMIAHFEKPTFTYRGAKLVETSQSTAVVDFLFTAHNPNEAGVKNVTCSYELFVEGKKFMTGMDVPLTLEPKGDTEVTVRATIAYEDLFPVLGSIVRRILSGRRTIPITINAVLSGKPALYGETGKETPVPFEMSLTRTADIPLPQERRNGKP